MVGETGTHRAYLTPLSNHLTIGALELAPAPAPESFPVTDWPDISWRDSDQLIHLDALTPARYQVLPFTGARKIDSGVVPYLLAHLVDVDMPFTIAVPGGGCVQLHRATRPWPNRPAPTSRLSSARRGTPWIPSSSQKAG